MDFRQMAAMDKDRIVRELDVAAVAAIYGVTFDSSGMGFCPFHDNKNTPALASFVGDDGKRRLHCHGCGWRGDVIDFVGAKEQVAYAAALARCAELLADGLEAPPAPERELVDFRGAVTDARSAAATEPLPIMELLAERHSPIDLAWLLQEFRLGVRGQEILVPHYAVGEETPHAVKVRGPRGGKSSLSGSRLKHLYGAWRDRRCKDVIIVEGESDTWLLAWLYKDERIDVLGLPRGVGSQVDPEWVEMLAGRRVLLLFDADDAGRRGLRRWVPAIFEKAEAVLVGHLPESTDPSSCRLEELFTALREAARVVDVSGLPVFRSGDRFWRQPPKSRADDGPKPITDWPVRVLRRIEVPGRRIVFEVELPNGRIDTLSSEDLGDARGLTRWANRHGLAVQASTSDVQHLLRLLEQESIFVPRVTGVSLAGWHEGSFVFPQPVGTIGTPAFAYVAPEIDAKWEERLRLAQGSPDGDVAPTLARLHRPDVMTPLLGWAAAAPLRALCAQFPSLGVMGAAGAGKTTLLAEVLTTFGFSDGTPITISNTTPHGVWGMVGSTNALPVWFDEYRFGAREDGLRALDQSIRDAWNGSSALRGGVGENKSALVTFPATAPIVVTGESAFQEQSHAERMVIVSLPWEGRDADALAQLRELRRDGFGRDYLEWLLWAIETDELDAPPALNDRPEQAVAVVRWGYATLRRYVKQRYGRAIPLWDESLIRAEQTAMADSSPILEAIREMFGATDPATGGLVVWVRGEDVFVRHGRLPTLVRQHTTIVLPGNSSAIRKWLADRFPGAYECREGGRYLVLPGARGEIFG